MDVVLPVDQIEGTTSAVSKWFKGVGDAVRKDDPLLEVTTDKVTVEIAAPTDGVLAGVPQPGGERGGPADGRGRAGRRRGGSIGRAWGGRGAGGGSRCRAWRRCSRADRRTGGPADRSRRASFQAAWSPTAPCGRASPSTW